MSKKWSKYRFRFSFANTEDQFFLLFLTIFDKNAGHRVIKFYQDTCISTTQTNSNYGSLSLAAFLCDAIVPKCGTSDGYES